MPSGHVEEIGTTASRTPPRREGAVLLTGATGFLGMELLARLLERSDRQVYALVRARDEAAASRRLDGVVESLFGAPDAHRDRVRAVRGDVCAPGLGLDPAHRAALAAEVTDVVHAAASVSFSLPLEQSRRINVEGTREVLDLAGECARRGGLERLAYVSTAYVAGTHAGPFREDELEVGQGFRNAYERSKYEAERLVRASSHQLPVQVFRPSIIVGEGSTGWTPSFNVLYSPLRAYARRSLPLLPARRSAPVDVVPVDYVADAIFELWRRPLTPGEPVYHLVAGDRAATVQRLTSLAARHFARRPPPVVPAGLYRRVIHPLLKRRGDERQRRALRRLEAFFPYFTMQVRFDDRRARSRLRPAGIEPPPLERYFRRLVDFAERAAWGRRPISRAQAQGGAR